MADQIVETLPHGYQLNEYRIDRKIGGGGFSQVYLAYDAENTPVAIKEYLPDGLVKREGVDLVKPISDEQTKAFLHGMKYFFEEGKALAGIQHPNVVRVTNFFRANETVYMVMAYERGKTLQRYIQELRDEPMREGFIRRVFVHLLNGLREVHTQKLLHLDIKPSNIYVRKDGTPLLIDFGAARQAQFMEAKTHTPMYTPGFAAPEQYNQRERLGPWTDIYATGASMYACMLRAAPPPAPDRLENDKMVPASKAFAGKYSPGLLALVDSMLCLNYMQRPQSVFAIQKQLVALPPHRPQAAPETLFARIKKTLTKSIL